VLGDEEPLISPIAIWHDGQAQRGRALTEELQECVLVVAGSIRLRTVHLRK
jgi:hypothetical protein